MVKRNSFQQDNIPKKEISEKEKDWLEQTVYVEFFNIEEPGLMQKFSYGTTKNHKTYTLMHGGKYHLPRKVVNHLQSRATPIYKWLPDGAGTIQKQMIGSKPRFQCRELFEESQRVAA